MWNVLQQLDNSKVEIECSICGNKTIKNKYKLERDSCKICKVSEKLGIIQKNCDDRGYTFNRDSYTTSDAPVQIICDKGHIIFSRADNAVYGNFSCKECTHEVNQQKRLATNQKKIQKRANKKLPRTKAERAQNAKSIRRKNLVKILETHNGCQICGEKRYSCIELHHINPAEKEKAITDLLQVKWGTRLQSELDKCCVLCCNCHMLYHRGGLDIEFVKHDVYGYTVKNYQYTNCKISYTKEVIFDLIDQKSCSNCNNGVLAILEFHHVNPTDKKFILTGRLGNDRRKTKIGDKLLTELMEEVDKCAVLCRNCHQAFEHNELSLTFQKQQIGYTCNV